MPASLATWEDAVRLHASYPRAPIWVPEQVLLRRTMTKSGLPSSQARIKWTGLPASHATWEDEEKLHNRFPEAPAWGQAGTEEGGDVTVGDVGPPSAPSTDPRPKTTTTGRPAHVVRPSTRYASKDWTM
ncbi:hypothetical protein QYE76_057967 [Lolium multiflorum]|uniref:Chromo domain-containing protein n=1 Tax=Lolium multiflorum TaxID=4521 RepID=A0AAD8T4K9_LOLMU|nr:hypothetical protein QYE76_057967 [Lolium multiflorum]